MLPRILVRPPFDPGSLPPGTRVGGKYELGPPIGVGQHSVVYVALHRFLQRKAAVKVFAATDERGERRFAREARLAGSIEHPNVVKIYEVGRIDDGRPFLVMEYLEGETVEQRMRYRGHPFEIAEALDIVRALLNGLAAAHEKQIVHRDLRPANLFLAQVRAEEVLKILDFGISRRLDDLSDSTPASHETLYDKMGYLAPEQLDERTVVDHRTDLYSTGVLLYELLAGRKPFTSPGPALLADIAQKVPKPPSAWRPDIPKDIDHVVLKALAKRPEDRFESAEGMAEALRLASIFAQYLSGG